jgi:hypothetical protein
MITSSMPDLCMVGGEPDARTITWVGGPSSGSCTVWAEEGGNDYFLPAELSPQIIHGGALN